MVEYSFLVVAVALAAALGCMIGGVKLVTTYSGARNQVLHMGP